MSFLYPRLLRVPARELAKQYRELSAAELAGSWTTSDESAVYVATGGDRVPAAKLADLRELVVDLAHSSGFPNEPSAQQKSSFDLALAVLLHSEMGIDPAEAAAGDIWAFLALIVLPDVAHWRYPNPPGDRVRGTDLTRHVFGRLWWRAYLIYAPEDEEPYAALTVLGEAAFDQIYARRTALGGSPHLVKSILRVWNSLDFQDFSRGVTGVSERAVLQDFLKRLLRLAPFVIFEAVEEQALVTELRAVAEEALSAMLVNAGMPEEEAVVRVAHVLTDAGSAPQISPLPDSVRTMRRRRDSSVSRSMFSLDPVASTEHAAAAEPQPIWQQVVPEVEPLQSYKAYEGQSFGDPRELGLRALADAVTEVVSVEGPVRAERVYRLITRLNGGRLRDNARTALVEATKYAKRENMIDAENHLGRNGFAGATLRLPDHPICVLRERGPRELDEIPEREIAAAVRMLQEAEPDVELDDVIKRVSLLFGYERCTRNVFEAIAESAARYPT
ncbi:DUF6339 domain-containing protein [Nocardia ninae]|uniref:Uncharacterized protein n=1 Tax=Nocardia ninae NBRC 108245 TaxID=1210091 RepID=A0A511M906_9NOCA|nr:DUF6339 family protein [Nocardia ninae]GEM37011.1 hypothetical protein NN4_15300 [Nocardia ninae NBRC 108245]